MRATEFIVALSMVFTLGLTTATVGQDLSGKAAGFSVEGDVYANLIQFGVFAGSDSTDDWFKNDDLHPGPGIGVIDTTGGGAYWSNYAQYGGAQSNMLFVAHMAYPKNEVPPGGNNLLFDAIYVRDWNSAQANLDSSVFTTTQEKNIDNPRTWNIGTKGTPSKNDIVDVYAHMRYDGPNDTDDLWFFMGLSTMASDGSAHNDFEFFRQADILAPGATGFTGTGPDSGHTAWWVDDATHEVTAGDLIFSVDFNVGGTDPEPTIRIWIRPEEQTDLETYAGLTFTGTYDDGGTDAGPFGYYELQLSPGDWYARINGVPAYDPEPHNTLGPPWGTLEGYAGYQDSIQELQFAECAINLSSVNLGDVEWMDPSRKLFGYILFKTRSSASFVAELKDYVGPYPFGEQIVVTCEAIGDSACDGGVVVLDTVHVEGGTPPYEFCWDAPPYDGVCDHVGTPWTIDPVSLSDAGTYRLMVVDQDGYQDTCYADLVIFSSSCSLVCPDPLVDCGSAGNKMWPDGVIGQAPFTYDWSVSENGWSKTGVSGVYGDTVIYTAGTDSGFFKLVITDDNGCVDSCEITCMCSGAVPVVLANFQATSGQGFIALKWVTASEINCHFWEVYRSQREDCEYAKIGELPGHGSTEAAHTYKWVDRPVKPGATYFYKLKQIDFDGSFWWSHIVSATVGAGVPKSHALHQNYPNPFNPVTEIKYDLPKDAHVSLKVYNILGAEVATLVEADQKANFYTVSWDASELAGGVYFCTMRAGDFTQTRKMVLLK